MLALSLSYCAGLCIIGGGLAENGHKLVKSTLEIPKPKPFMI